MDNALSGDEKLPSILKFSARSERVVYPAKHVTFASEMWGSGSKDTDIKNYQQACFQDKSTQPSSSREYRRESEWRITTEPIPLIVVTSNATSLQSFYNKEVQPKCDVANPDENLTSVADLDSKGNSRCGIQVLYANVDWNEEQDFLIVNNARQPTSPGMVQRKLNLYGELSTVLKVPHPQESKRPEDSQPCFSKLTFSKPKPARLLKNHTKIDFNNGSTGTAFPPSMASTFPPSPKSSVFSESHNIENIKEASVEAISTPPKNVKPSVLRKSKRFENFGKGIKEGYSRLKDSKAPSKLYRQENVFADNSVCEKLPSRILNKISPSASKYSPSKPRKGLVTSKRALFEGIHGLHQ